MAPFFVPIFWAVVLSVVFHPYYRLLRRRMRLGSAVASLLTCVSVVAFIVVPAVLLASSLAAELASLYRWAEGYLKGMTGDAGGSAGLAAAWALDYVESLAGDYIDISSLDIKSHVASLVKSASAFLTNALTGAVVDITRFMLDTALAFFILYYMLKEGEGFVSSVKGLLPLSEEKASAVLEKTGEVVSATLYGGVLVSAMQGILGGTAFWVLGLSSPVLWGMFMMIAAFLPLVGPALIWAPAAVYLVVKGSVVKAVLLALWGVVVVGLADNILRPLIVSGRTNLHPLLLFLSILGAINVFGIIGLVAGPLVLSVAMAAVEIYREGAGRESSGGV